LTDCGLAIAADSSLKSGVALRLPPQSKTPVVVRRLLASTRRPGTRSRQKGCRVKGSGFGLEKGRAKSAKARRGRSFSKCQLAMNREQGVRYHAKNKSGETPDFTRETRVLHQINHVQLRLIAPNCGELRLKFYEDLAVGHHGEAAASPYHSGLAALVPPSQTGQNHVQLRLIALNYGELRLKFYEDLGVGHHGEAAASPYPMGTRSARPSESNRPKSRPVTPHCTELR